MAVRVTGAQVLRDLGETCKLLGEDGKWLRKELFAGMQRASKLVKAAARQSAMDTLPRGGGLNTYVAGARLTTKVSITGRQVGVRVLGSRQNVRSAAVERSRKAHRKAARAAGQKVRASKDPNPTVDLRAIDRGRLRHPLFGARGQGQWFNQQVRPGWWTKAMTGPAAKACRKEAGQAVGRALAVLGRSRA